MPFLPVVYLGELHNKGQKGRLQIMPSTCSRKPGGSRTIAENTFDILLSFFKPAMSSQLSEQVKIALAEITEV